jgi:hypothetical protein
VENLFFKLSKGARGSIVVKAQCYKQEGPECLKTTYWYLILIFGLKRDGVTEGCRKLHNGELRDSYTSPSAIIIIKSKRMRWAGHVARMGEKRTACWLLVGKAEGKRPLGRPRPKCIDNIKINLV